MNAFANALLDLEPRGGRRRTEQQPAVGGESIGDAEARAAASGPTTVRSICSRSASASSASRSARSIGDGRGERGDPGISGRADDVADVAIGGQPGDQRVLARAAADDENSHCANDLGRATGCTTRCDGDYFVDLDGDCA